MLMDADLELVGEKSTLKQELEERLLIPQLAKEEATRAFLLPPGHRAVDAAAGGSGSGAAQVSSTLSPLYSAILFGPPGKRRRDMHKS
jgi:hypothetical protein